MMNSVSKVSRWWYVLAVIIVAMESSISMPLLSVGICILLLTNNEKWLLIVVMALSSWWLAVALGLSWGGVVLLLWVATAAQRYLSIPISPSQKFMLLSLVITLILEWWRGVSITPSYGIGTAFSLIVLLLMSRLLYVKHQVHTPLARSLSRFELFLSR